jgi:hypothetical protein
VSASTTGSLLFFVGGDPSVQDELDRFPPSFRRTLVTFLLPPGMLFPGTPRSTRSDPEAPWTIPADQLMCAERLTAAVHKTGRPLTVKVIDVNRPGDDRELVQRYVGPGDVLPVLVRPDGLRVEGAEAFTPAVLRRFLSTGPTPLAGGAPSSGPK